MRFLEIHIEVSNFEKSIELYSKLIPHTKIKYWEDKSAAALVLEDGSAFGIWKNGKLGLHNGRGGQHLHFAFQIENTEYNYYLKLIKELSIEPIEHLWPDGQRSIYFFDYDGHQGEFMTKDWL